MCASSQGASRNAPTEKSSYTSIVIKTGIGYRWKPSLIYLAMGAIIGTTPLVLGGVPLYLIATDLVSLMILVVVPFTTYIMKNTLKEFQDMFGLTSGAPSQRAELVRRIFPGNDEYDRFRNQARKTTSSAVELLYGTIFAVAFVIVMQPWNWQMALFGGLDYRGVVNEYTAIRNYIALTWIASLVFFIGVGVFMILVMMGSVSLIGKTDGARSVGKGDRRASDDDARDEGESTSRGDVVYFSEFHASLREIGVFMYRLCVKLIIVGFLMVVAFIAYDLLFTATGQVSLRGIMVSFILLLGVSVLFILPQMSIHGSLVRSKERILSDLNTGYGEVQMALLQSMHDPNYLKKQSTWKTNSEIIDQAAALDRMISHVKGMGAWSFSWPTVLKLLAAAAVPLLTAILQVIGSGLLKGFVPL